MCKLVFERDQDAAMRLNGCVVMYAGEPVYVMEAGKKNSLVCDLDEKEQVKVATNDLDLSPVLIGNVQMGNHHIYLQRIPIRRWKQGLHRENLDIGKTLFAKLNIPMPRIDVCTKAFKKAIKGEFGKPMDVMRKVMNGDILSGAINRHWAVAKINGVDRLFYKDQLVGFVDDGEITISKKYFFLKEDLLGVLNG